MEEESSDKATTSGEDAMKVSSPVPFDPGAKESEVSDPAISSAEKEAEEPLTDGNSENPEKETPALTEEQPSKPQTETTDKTEVTKDSPENTDKLEDSTETEEMDTLRHLQSLTETEKEGTAEVEPEDTDIDAEPANKDNIEENDGQDNDKESTKSVEADQENKPSEEVPEKQDDHSVDVNDGKTESVKDGNTESVEESEKTDNGEVAGDGEKEETEEGDGNRAKDDGEEQMDTTPAENPSSTDDKSEESIEKGKDSTKEDRMKNNETVNEDVVEKDEKDTESIDKPASSDEKETEVMEKGTEKASEEATEESETSNEVGDKSNDKEPIVMEDDEASTDVTEEKSGDEDKAKERKRTDSTHSEGDPITSVTIEDTLSKDMDKESKGPNMKGGSKQPKACIVCKKVCKCKYNIVRNGDVKHLCDDKCFKSFRSSPTKYLRSEASEKEKAAALEASSNLKKLSNLSKQQCCTTCSSIFNLSSISKFEVKSGNIKPFCSNKCLQDNKAGRKLCGFCKMDIQDSAEAIMASIYDDNFLRNFCNKQCHEQFEEKNKDVSINENDDVVEIPDDNDVSVSPTPTPTPTGKKKPATPPTVTQPEQKKSAGCSVCHKVLEVKHEVTFDGKCFTLCGDSCFNTFRYANKLAMNECSFCGAHCFSEGNNPHAIQFEGQTKKFCSMTCINAFKVDKSKTVACTWCQAKKTNFDMIERVDANNKYQLFCSLNCLSLYRVNLQATSNQSVPCDQCKRTAPAQYHLTMSDASVRNFCQYNCVMAFQAQFTAPSKNATPQTRRQGGKPTQAAMPSVTPATRQSARLPAKSTKQEMGDDEACVCPKERTEAVSVSKEEGTGERPEQDVTESIIHNPETQSTKEEATDQSVSTESEVKFEMPKENILSDQKTSPESGEQIESAMKNMEETEDIEKSDSTVKDSLQSQSLSQDSAEGTAEIVSEEKPIDSEVQDADIANQKDKPSNVQTLTEDKPALLQHSPVENDNSPCRMESVSTNNESSQLEPNVAIDKIQSDDQSSAAQIDKLESDQNVNTVGTKDKIASVEGSQELTSQVFEDTNSSISSASKSEVSDVLMDTQDQSSINTVQSVEAPSPKTTDEQKEKTTASICSLKELCTQALLSQRRVHPSDSFADQVGIGHIQSRRGRGRPPGKHKHKKRGRKREDGFSDDPKDPDFSLHEALELMPKKRGRGRKPKEGGLVLSLKRVMSTESDSPDPDDEAGLRKSTRRRTPTYKVSSMTQKSTGSSANVPVISNVMSLASNDSSKGAVQNSTNSTQVGGVQTSSVGSQIIIQPPAPKIMRNKSMLCKPFTQTKATACRPHTQNKECQTDESNVNKPVLVPVPIPVYIPVPMAMYNVPQPYPLPIPLPVPIPFFVPTTKKNADGILKHIKEIQERMPADPFEAELLMMAEAVASADKSDSSDESDDDGGNAPEPTFDPSLPMAPSTPPGVNTANDMGEDMLSMALRMAEMPPGDEGQLDLEDSIQSTPISQPPVQPSHEVSVTEPEFSTIDQNSEILSASRGRGGWRGKRSRRGRGSSSSQRAKKPKVEPAESEQIMSAPTPVLPPPPADANMVLKYSFGVNAWKHWVVQKNTQLDKASTGRGRLKLFKTDILQCTSDELNYSLCLFVKEVRKPNGEEYAPDSIYYLCLGIQQYLFENGRIDNIFTDFYYEKFTECLNDILQRYEVRLNTLGLIVCRIEEEHLWESKQLGAHSPHVLLNTLVYFNTKSFMLKTAEEHIRLSFSHIMKHWKKTNIPGTRTPGRSVYLRYYAPVSAKENSSKRKREEVPVYEQAESVENPLRCPVKLYEFYLSKCPESIRNRNDVFYLVPERSCVPDSPVWYSTASLGIDAMTKMLNRVRVVREIQMSHIHHTPMYSS